MTAVETKEGLSYNDRGLRRVKRGEERGGEEASARAQLLARLEVDAVWRIKLQVLEQLEVLSAVESAAAG